MNDPLEILYQDEYMVVINKPNGLLVHRTKLAANVRIAALNILRDQLGRIVHPVHRLDRKTSGVLVFSFEKETTKRLQAILASEGSVKDYTAIVRGYFPEQLLVDYPLTNEKGKQQSAITRFCLLDTTELDVPLGQHNTSRYSLIKAFPKTGRMHQIRKHCNHLRHPIIGDRPHGCNKQNRLFKEKWRLENLLLHASKLKIKHPYSHQDLVLEANFPDSFIRIKKILDLSECKTVIC